MNPEYKVVLLGPCNVGKTMLISAYQGMQGATTPTIAASTVQFEFTVDSQKIVLNVWDTAGHEKFQSLVPMYARTADSMIVVYDLSSSGSFQEAKKSYENVIEDVGTIPVVVLVGNKVDIAPDACTTDEELWAEENKLLYMKTSAKEMTNVDLLFETIANKLFNMEAMKQISCVAEVDIGSRSKTEQKGCC